MGCQRSRFTGHVAMTPLVASPALSGAKGLPDAYHRAMASQPPPMKCPWCKQSVNQKALDLFTCIRLSTMRVALVGDEGDRVATIEISADANHPKGDSRSI